VFGTAAAAKVRAEDGEYERLVKDALSEFAARHYLESRALFLQAHELKPSARTLRGLGQAAFGAKLYGQTIVDLQGALESGINPLPPTMRREVERTIQRARSYVGRFKLTLNPPDSQVVVDGGQPVFDRDGALLLDTGERQVVVRAKDRVERETMLRVAGGEEKTLDLSVSLAATLSDRDPIPQPTPEPSHELPTRSIQLETAPRTPPEPPSEAGSFPWLAVGAFGAAAISGGIGIWQWQHRNARITSWNVSACSLMTDEPACQSLNAGWHRATTAGIIAFSLAGAFGATGIVLLAVRSTPHADVALACTPLGIGVGCQLRM
jgi:hypothetical protein